MAGQVKFFDVERSKHKNLRVLTESDKLRNAIKHNATYVFRNDTDRAMLLEVIRDVKEVVTIALQLNDTTIRINFNKIRGGVYMLEENWELPMKEDDLLYLVIPFYLYGM